MGELEATAGMHLLLRKNKRQAVENAIREKTEKVGKSNVAFLTKKEKCCKKITGNTFKFA